MVFAATNHRSFTTGGERSVVSVYRSLWRLLYSNERYGVSCECEMDIERIQHRHTVFGTTAYPWRVRNDTAVRFAYDSENTENLVTAAKSTFVNDYPSGEGITIARKIIPTVDYTLANSRLINYPYDITEQSSSNPWLCNASLLWNTSNQNSSIVKLLDYRFDDPRKAWALILDIVEWCERVYENLDFYPTQRSVWDILVLSDNNAKTCSPSVRFVSTGGLTDIGDICSYVYTLRVLMLIIYLGCSYGGMARAASVNDRVSNRIHRCVFPAKTSGIYHALFHTSVQPHRLFCAAAISSGRTATSSYKEDESTQSEQSTIVRATQWLNNFRNLCANAAIRYDLPIRDYSLSTGREGI